MGDTCGENDTLQAISEIRPPIATGQDMPDFGWRNDSDNILLKYIFLLRAFGNPWVH